MLESSIKDTFHCFRKVYIMQGITLPKCLSTYNF